MKKEKIAATLTVRRCAEMTPAGRRDIGNWLKRLAKDVEQHGNSLAPRFQARYLYFG